MWDMNSVTRIRYVRDHVYFVEFDDGKSGEIDLSDYLRKGPVFQALADPEFFRQARVEGGTISWPNGADIAPERVYELLESANQSVEPTPTR